MKYMERQFVVVFYLTKKEYKMSSNVKRQNAKGFIELKQSKRVEFIVFNRFWLNQEENEEPMEGILVKAGDEKHLLYYISFSRLL